MDIDESQKHYAEGRKLTQEYLLHDSMYMTLESEQNWSTVGKNNHNSACFWEDDVEDRLEWGMKDFSEQWECPISW